MRADREAQAREVAARIAAEAERSLAVLREMAKSANSKALRERAKRTLRRYTRNGESPNPNPQPSPGSNDGMVSAGRAAGL